MPIKSKILNMWKSVKLVKNWPSFLFNYVFVKGPHREININLRNNTKILIPHTRNPIGVFIEVYLKEQYSLDKYGFSEPSVILDIGGFMGISALFYANRYPDKKIHVYEPVPFNFNYIRKNININNLQNRVFPYQEAVFESNTTEELTFTTDLSDMGGSSLIKARKVPSTAENPNATKIKVKTVAFNDILTELDSDQIFIKMDIEGAEYPILYNSDKNLIRKCSSMILEYHFRDKEKRNGDYLHKFIESLGYQVTILPDQVNPRLGLMMCSRK